MRCSTLRLDGTWAAPQLIRFADKDGVADARIVEDPLDLTVVHELEARITQMKEVQHPALDEEVRTKTTQRNQASDAIPPLVQARQAAEAALYAPLTFDQGLEVAGLIAIGVPPDNAWWIVKASREGGLPEGARQRERGP